MRDLDGKTTSFVATRPMADAGELEGTQMALYAKRVAEELYDLKMRKALLYWIELPQKMRIKPSRHNQRTAVRLCGCDRRDLIQHIDYTSVTIAIGQSQV